jgi:meso-butanediol dehydrogenase / (S,S)-butanediol dehydrogenase / diacetyl reductase
LIRDAGGDAEAFPADCSDWDTVRALADAVLERYGRIDIVHANAGVLRPGSAAEQRIEDWDATFAVNVRGMFLLVKAVVPGMLQRGGGVIVLTASTAGLLGEPGIAAYCASKGAVVNLTRQLAVDYARHGIRVNCVCPGWIDTGFNDPMLAGVTDTELASAIDQMVPLGRQGRPEEIARVVAFLASDDAALIHGHALVADGGLTAQ